VENIADQLCVGAESDRASRCRVQVKRSGVQEFRSSGVQEFRGPGFSEVQGSGFRVEGVRFQGLGF
jgi:hypothetical protein